MCGRFSSYISVDEASKLFEIEQQDFRVSPSYNVAPTDPVLACRHPHHGSKELAILRWGLIPSWSKDPNSGYRMINARAETIAEKPAFRSAFRKRRCIIPVNGFYEWKKSEQGKQPFYFHMENQQVFCLAGLWEHWHGGSGHSIESFTIIVTQANSFISRYHDRMPVILDRASWNQWLDPDNENTDSLKSLLIPCESGSMAVYPVSRQVNNPRNDGSELIQPIDLET